MKKGLKAQWVTTMVIMIATVVANGGIPGANSVQTTTDPSKLNESPTAIADTTGKERPELLTGLSTSSGAAGEGVDWYVLSNGGGPGTTAHYLLNGTVCQTAVGRGTVSALAIHHGFWQGFARTCCVGRVGDANGVGVYPNEVTIGDISTIIDAKFISGTCEGKIACLAEADVNQSGGVDPNCDDITISDISTLVNHLFIEGPTNAPLNDCL